MLHGDVTDAVCQLLRRCGLEAQAAIDLHGIWRRMDRDRFSTAVREKTLHQCRPHSLPVIVRVHEKQGDMGAAGADGQDADDALPLKGAIVKVFTAAGAVI